MKVPEQVAEPDRTVVNHDSDATRDKALGLISSVDRFLLACAVLEFNRETEQEILGRLQTELEWDDIIARASHHGLIPLLYHHLSRPSLREHVPENVSNILKNGFYFSAANALRAHAVLENILEDLNKSGVEPIILKGLAIISSVYPDPALRPFGDIDLLIKEEDWPEVRSSLLELGFEQVGKDYATLPPRLIAGDMLDHALEFRRQDGFLIECKLDPLELGLRMRALDSVWDRAEEFAVGAGKARKLSLEDELLMLCVHLNRHGYQRLMWFMDIAELIKKNMERIEWKLLLDLSRHENILPSMFYTFTYTNKLFGEFMPDVIINRFKPTWIQAKVWQSSWSQKRLLSFDGQHEAALIFYKTVRSKWFIPNLLLTGRFMEKMSYFLRKLLPPKEFIAIKYPEFDGDSSYVQNLLNRYWLFYKQASNKNNRADKILPKIGD